jgi:hypothetical protein
LIALLETESIKKVSSKISANCLYKAGVTLGRKMNLQHMAKERGAIRVATIGLADIFKKLFDGVKLDKDKEVRLSNWQSAQLSTEQIAYAILDSRANALFLEVETNTVCRPVENAPSFDKGFVGRSQVAIVHAKQGGCCCRRVFRGSMQGGHSFWCGGGQKACCCENHKCAPTLCEDLRDERQDIRRTSRRE